MPRIPPHPSLGNLSVCKKAIKETLLGRWGGVSKQAKVDSIRCRWLFVSFSCLRASGNRTLSCWIQKKEREDVDTFVHAQFDVGTADASRTHTHRLWEL